MSRKQLDALWSEARDLDDSPIKVAILEKAVRMADSLGNLDEGYRLREELVAAATLSDQRGRAQVAFAWCLAQSDKDPERFPEHGLLWEYNYWILNTITDFPNIPLEKIRALQDDLENRLRRGGYGLKSYYDLRINNAKDMGCLAERDKFNKLWRQAKDDKISDCRACKQDRWVNVYLDERNYPKVIDAARPILSGNVACDRVPHDTYGSLIEAYWALRKKGKAEEMFCRGYRLVGGDRNCPLIISRLLNYLVRICDIRRGLNLIERHLPCVASLNNSDARACFFSRIANFFERLAIDRPQSRKVRIPRVLPIHNDEGHYTPAALAAWFREESEKIAALFDVRNGNNYFSWQLARTRADVLGLAYPDYEEPQPPQPASKDKKGQSRFASVRMKRGSTEKKPEKKS
ncbi:MAG: hypothetical protein ACR2FY_13500 [Pirellulaceae bacterium]